MGTRLKLEDLEKFKRGSLTFVRPTNNLDRHGRYLWILKCDCGKLVELIPNVVLTGNTRSCGCVVKEILVKRNKENTKHGYYSIDNPQLPTEHVRKTWRKANRIYRKTEKGIFVNKLREARDRTAGTINLQDWREILIKQGNKCNICLRTFDENFKATLDHIIPVSKGGETLVNNVQALCRSCNSRKGNRI